MSGNGRASEILARLMDGNRRYVEGVRVFPGQSLERRKELVAGQRPLAAILSCSDSRVVPEMIFDQGMGDLFVVRVAGNIIDEATCASLEYAVCHLGVRLIMVLGHTGCGAVKAAIAGDAHEGSLAGLLAAIQPAVESARSDPGPLDENTVRRNVELVVDALQCMAPVLSTATCTGDVQIVGAVYDLASGAVALL